MSKKIEIERSKLMEAYKAANDEQKQLLINLYGKDIFKPADVRERIKTFEDACRELDSRCEDNHPLVSEFEALQGYFCENDNLSKDILAYLQLRIICAALNEGWEPTFANEEYRWYPWFVIYTKDELARMDEEKRRRVVGRSYYNAGAIGGLVYAYAGYASSYSFSSFGSRLAFKSEELADYAGKQFIEIYADFVAL